MPLPRPRLERLLKSLLVVGCETLVASCGGGGRSPFTLFGRDDFRPGTSYEGFAAHAREESSVPLVCASTWAHARRCEIAIEAGRVEAIVDSTGRIVRFVVVTADSVASGASVHGRGVYSATVRETVAGWDSVVGASRLSVPHGTEERWTARRGPWTASSFASTVDDLRRLPDSLAVADAAAYARFVARRPPLPAPVTPLPNGSPDSIPRTPAQIVAAMHSDLRALSAAQEKFLHDAGVYATTLDTLHVHMSPGVRLTMPDARIDGYSAIATHPGLPGRSCVVWAGEPPSVRRTAHDAKRGREGEIVCDASGG